MGDTTGLYADTNGHDFEWPPDHKDDTGDPRCTLCGQWRYEVLAGDRYLPCPVQETSSTGFDPGHPPQRHEDV